MTRSGYRIALMALGVVAVAVGATLFPPTGFGPAPADGVDLLEGSGDAAGDGGPGDGNADPVTRTADAAGTPGAQPSGSGTPTSTGPTPITPVTGDATPTGTPAATPTGTPAATPTPTDTPTQTPEPDEESGGFPLGIAVVGVAAAVVFVLVATVFGSRRSEGHGGRGSGSGSGALPLPAALGGIGRVSPARLATRVPQVTMVALVGFSTGTARVLGTAGSVGRDVLAGLSVAVGAGSRSATRGLVAGLSGLFSVPSPSLGSLSVSGVLSGLSTGGSSAGAGRSPIDDARRMADVEPDEDGDEPIRTVEDAWAAFASPLPVADPEARTPGEFARLAVEYGDPADPVHRLTAVFRDVRYGGRPATDDRTRTAVDAATAIADGREDDE